MANHSPSKAIQWRDLCTQSYWSTLLELIRPLSLCAVCIWAANIGWLWLSWCALLFAHIAALRSAHGAVHHTLGLPKLGDRAVLFSVSALLATSCHALEFTHKLHHRRCGQDIDVEGRIAHMGFWRACLTSPTYHWQVIRAAWGRGDRHRRIAIALDLTLGFGVHTLLFVLIGTSAYWIWLGLLVLNASSGLLSVWLFHRGNVETRSAQSTLLNWLAMGMLYHGEHHLYPGVPTARLAELAKRLKAADAGTAPLLEWHVLRSASLRSGEQKPLKQNRPKQIAVLDHV